ncbi:hypothetical protein JMJ35_005837 [Cladonia borealis]|uniref:Subtilisin-like serine protease n=1 Tax=Cladonia borealis TaxID=184061 RepID=A0AA39R0B8_9LECA|nr:hypothetical protein JMJ35_005837 [Cladonia borealis]
MDFAPFLEAHQLDDTLELRVTPDGSHCNLVRAAGKGVDSLPGMPRVKLDQTSFARDMAKELLTTDLNVLQPWLWLVATQKSSHIAALHDQIVRGRNIIITEKPGLHCVWNEDRVFIKPMPRWLMSHAWWRFVKKSSEGLAPPGNCDWGAIYRAALGFTRSYYYLVIHESDFDLAQHHKLIPIDITFEAFHKFIEIFRDIQDTDVSLRYTFGDLRLSRLNWLAKSHLGRLHYLKVHRQYHTYFSRFYGPLLFIFGLFTVVLDAMQVTIGSTNGAVDQGGGWDSVTNICRWFSITTILVVLSIILLLLCMLSFRVLRELVFALKDMFRLKKRRGGADAREKVSLS